MHRSSAWFVVVALACLSFGLSGALAKDPPKADSGDELIPIAALNRTKPVDFEGEVLPILKKNCLACHNATQAESKLVLETPQTILKGGENGPAAMAKNGAESLLVVRSRGGGDGIMPPEGNKVAAVPLKPEEIALLKLWIDQGATGTVRRAADTIQWQPLPPGVNPIYATALTSDGQFAACGRANQIFIYQVPTGRLVCRLTDPELLKSGIYKQPGVADLDLIQSLAFSPDGLTLASGGYRTAKLWTRPRNVRELALPEAAAAEGQALAVSADGKWLATAAAGDAVKLIDLATGKLAKSLSGHAAAVTTLIFSPDSTHLFSASLDKSVRIWRLADGVEAGRIDTPTGCSAMTLVDGGKQLATSGADGIIRVWTNPAAGTPAWSGVTEDVAALAISGDKKVIALALANGDVRVLSAADGKEVKKLAGLAGPITALALDPQGQKLVAVGGPQNAQVWDIAAGKLLATLESSVPLTAAALDNGGTVAVAGGKDGSLRVWKLDGLKEPKAKPEEKPLEAMKTAVVVVVLQGGANRAYAVAADGMLRGYQVSDRKTLFTAQHKAPALGLALSSDGKLLATSGEDKFVRVWNSANGQPGAKPQLGPLTAAARSVAFAGTGQQIVAGLATGDELAVYNLATAEFEQAFRGTQQPAVGVIALGERGEQILAAGPGGVRRGALAAVRQFSAGGKPINALATLYKSPLQIISGGDDGSLTLWDAGSAKQIRKYNHGGPIAAVAVRLDDLRLVSAGRDKIAKLWNTSDAKLVAEMRGDLRARALVALKDRNLNSAKSIATAEKADLAEAEKAATAEADNVKKTIEAKAAAEKSLTEKIAAEKKPAEEKAAADKALADANAETPKAADAKKKADDAFAKSDEAVKAATQALNQAKDAAKKDAKNKDLAEASTKAEKALAEAKSKLDAAKKAQADAQKSVTDVAAKVQKAMADVTAKDKAATDAKKARETAEIAKTTSEKAIASAEAAAKRAKDRVPEAQKALAAADVAVKQAEALAATAKTAATESEQPFLSVGFSSDGSQLATGSQAKLVFTWSSETGAALDVYEGHAGPVGAIAFAGDRRLISAAADKAIMTWDTEPVWTWVRTLGTSGPGFADRVTALAFSPDGKQLATGGGAPSRSGELKLWNMADSTLVRDLPDAHSDTVFGIEFSPDGHWLASCGADKFIKIFDAGTGKFSRSFEGHTHHVLCVSWQSDGKLLASGGADNAVKIWNLATGEQQRTVQAFGKEVTSLHFVGDTSTFVACSGDRSVKLIRATDGGAVRTFSGAVDYLYCCDATPDGKVVIAGGQDGVLRVWNGENAQSVRTFDPPPSGG